jgi:pyridoxamine 5'-phosphate oxidase
MKIIENTHNANLMKKIASNELSENTVNKNPFIQFSEWYDDVIKLEISFYNAMVVATANNEAIPSVRVVFLKSYDENGFVFYTNYESHKAKDLIENPLASLLFHWKELERQIRIVGKVEKTSKEESEIYFHSRPKDSQISAWASKQSSIITNRIHLENEFIKYKNQFDDKEVPLPPFWGGFRVIPFYFEFWKGRENRLHDRIAYQKENNNWKIFRLSP